MAPLASLWSRRPSSVDQNIAITAGEDSYISVSESLSSTHTPSPLVQPGGQHCTSKTVISDSSAGIQTADGSRSEKIVLITVCNSSMPLQPENNDQLSLYGVFSEGEFPCNPTRSYSHIDQHVQLNNNTGGAGWCDSFCYKWTCRAGARYIRQYREDYFFHWSGYDYSKCAD
ncbi:hypothetical protein BDQ12DRAFT_663382 [Crucibulum laeve]|uniref:Uncharacterized protein n=1 Tax=Crucibulum laeve TaxID=68775 RepID=A0A5C3MA37_9AGAR|nr:hypothetical protein BDQ12DRAFT_663382 [Crucibulum laeve]